MKIVSTVNTDLHLFVPHADNRPEGLHLSGIIKEMAKEYYPKWFKEYTEEESHRQTRHFEKGLILEQAWGDCLSTMQGFSRPEPRQVDGVWMSPDGYVSCIECHGETEIETREIETWPDTWPNLIAPSVHECKVTLKSCNPRTSDIQHEKFKPWFWQVMGYCYGWGCHDAYLHVCHLLGDYGQKPWTPMGMLYYVQFTDGELTEMWDRLLTFAKNRKMI